MNDHRPERMHEMMNGMMGWGWVGAILGLLILLLIAAVLAASLVYLLKALRTPPGSDEGRSLEVLKERYARGEIDQAEYEERRRVLQA